MSLLMEKIAKAIDEKSYYGKKTASRLQTGGLSREAVRKGENVANVLGRVEARRAAAQSKKGVKNLGKAGKAVLATGTVLGAAALANKARKRKEK